jgi:hypothetical protein
MVALPKHTRIAYRDHLRDARAGAFSDAEGFQEVLFAIEHLGTALLGRASTLSAFEGKLRGLAETSPLAFCLSTKFRYLYTCSGTRNITSGCTGRGTWISHRKVNKKGRRSELQNRPKHCQGILPAGRERRLPLDP